MTKSTSQLSMQWVPLFTRCIVYSFAINANGTNYSFISGSIPSRSNQWVCIAFDGVSNILHSIDYLPLSIYYNKTPLHIQWAWMRWNVSMVHDASSLRNIKSPREFLVPYLVKRRSLEKRYQQLWSSRRKFFLEASTTSSSLIRCIQSFLSDV